MEARAALQVPRNGTITLEWARDIHEVTEFPSDEVAVVDVQAECVDLSKTQLVLEGDDKEYVIEDVQK